MTERKQNLLGQEKSPYLLQHKNNPVHWYPWGEEAFRAAQEQNKPIFLSVGYSTCHWCHVMAHESFEDQEVADFLNEHFIAIKVDREERPDVDDIYMAAVHAMGQRGGWPLSMFLTPDLKPFYGGTYWPKPQFLFLLGKLTELWREERNKLEESGKELMEHLRRQKAAEFGEGVLSEELFRTFFGNSLTNFDRLWGGFGPAPKFPHAMQLSMLLRIYRRSDAEEALQMVVHTLDKMARGGIYDHLGGGFARYSVDAQWGIPHFEKMLYDNALLAVCYLEAFQVSGIEMFERVAREILDYVLRVMTHPEGGFYSAEDADSEGKEGKFYVWTQKELQQALTEEEFQHFAKVYNVTSTGNFEGGTNHLHLHPDYGWDEQDTPLIKSVRKKLFEIRETRVHPHKDDKILTAWNGLMIRAMALGFQVTAKEKYLHAAHQAAQFLQKNLFKEEKLLARYREGEGRFSGRLEDYAFLIQGLIDLYQCDFRQEILKWAMDLQRIQDQSFWDSEKGGYFYTDGKDPSLLVRGKEGMDGALPSGNGVSVFNLLRLHDLNDQAAYLEKAKATLRFFSRIMQEYPQGFSQMLLSFDYYSDFSQEVAILENPPDGQALKLFQALRSGFYPNLVMARSETPKDFPSLLSGREIKDQKTTFYVCREQSCDAPTHEWRQVLEAVGSCKKYALGGGDP